MTVAVTGISAMTPVGDDAASSFAALRAQVSGIIAHPRFVLQPPEPEWDEPEPLRAGTVPSVDPDLEGPSRLVALAVAALRTLVQAGRITRAELAATPLFLALPEAGPDVEAWDLAHGFAPELLARAGRDERPPAHLEVIGHAGALAALAAADRQIAERRASRCLLLAVDGYLDRRRIADWDVRRGRLRSRRCLDGFLPGEAAVALLLEPSPRAARAELGSERAALALVEAPSFGQEPHTVEGDKAPTGKGMTDALRGAVGRRLGGLGASTAYLDLNGESYGAFDWSLARTRLSPALDAVAVAHPADCIGDVGAASGALLIGLAAHAFGRAPSAPRPALVVTASTSGVRAATIVSPPGAEPV